MSTNCVAFPSAEGCSRARVAHRVLRFSLARVIPLVCAALVALSAVPLTAADFALGADVGWLSQMEASGIKFRNSAGMEEDCLQVLQEVGIDSIRLRGWVNPADGWCGQADVVAMAVRAKRRGLRVMIDFHFSDWWADPGKQNKPAAWAGHNIVQLRADVQSHTTAVLGALKAAGVTPEWVQIGNETNNGMLWEEGRASTSMGNFASLITSGYEAVKGIFPNTKVIVHISNGYDSSLFRWMFEGLTANGAKFDVIAMSLYPTAANWSTLNTQCLANMQDMIARYGKEVMISEVGMPVNAPNECKAFIADLIAKAKSLPDGKGLGVFYWEPESYNRWQGYTLGAFGDNGSPTAAMDAFAEAAPPVTGQPQSLAVSSGSTATLTTAGTFSPTYQWTRNGTELPGTTSSILTLANVQPEVTGLYAAIVTQNTANFSDPAIVGITTDAKFLGSAEEVGPDIKHPVTQLIYDQLLLEGSSASFTADAGQVTRLSYIDLSNDIVQVEFSGPGTVSIVLDGATERAKPVNYIQDVLYVRGHAGIVVTGATENSNLSVFTVGRANAVNQTIFRDDVVYDGVAEIAFVAVLSVDGKFGGLRTANTSYIATRGLVGVYAPGVDFQGPLFVGNINASDDATPVLIAGRAADSRITGGDLLQTNARPVKIEGITSLKFTAGTTSHGLALPAQTNHAVLVENGVDVTAQVVTPGQ